MATNNRENDISDQELDGTTISNRAISLMEEAERQGYLTESSGYEALDLHEIEYYNEEYQDPYVTWKSQIEHYEDNFLIAEGEQLPEGISYYTEADITQALGIVSRQLVSDLSDGYFRIFSDQENTIYYRYKRSIYKVVKQEVQVTREGAYESRYYVSFVKMKFLDTQFRYIIGNPNGVLTNEGMELLRNNDNAEVQNGVLNDSSGDKLTIKEDKQLKSNVVKLVEIFTAKNDGTPKNLVSIVEPLVMASIAISAKKFWVKLFAGIGAALSMKLNEGLIESVGKGILKLLFGTNDVKQSSIYALGLKENLIKNKLYELISFMLIPFSTDLNLSIGQIEMVQVKCAERINGLDMFSAILEASTYIGHAAEHLKETGTIVGFCMTSNAMTTLVTDFSELNQTYIAFKTNPQSDFDYEGEMKKVTEFMARVSVQMKGSKSPSEAKYLSLISFILVDVFENYNARSRMGQLIPAAYCFNVFGESQVGKSTLVTYIMEHIQKIYGDEGKDIVFASGLQKTPEQFRNGHEYAILDDVGNVNPDFTQTSPLELILRLKNNVCTPLEQAALEKKGKVLLKLKALGITTNISDWNSHKFSVKSASMMLRGDVHIRCDLKSEYVRNGKLDSERVRREQEESGSNAPIDVWDITLYGVDVLVKPTPIKKQYYNEADPPSNAWAFDTTRHKGRRMEHIGISDLFVFIADKAREHRERQLAIVESAQNTNYEEIYCYKCYTCADECTCIDTTAMQEISVQSGPMAFMKRQFMMTASPLLGRMTSNATEYKIDEFVEGFSGSVGGVFGINITTEKLVKRIKAIFQLALHYLEESKRLHFLTLMPDKTFDDIPLKETIMAFETDKISRLAVQDVVSELWSFVVYMLVGIHGGLFGIFVMFQLYVGYDTCRSSFIFRTVHKWLGLSEEKEYLPKPVGYKMYIEAFKQASYILAYSYGFFGFFSNIILNAKSTDSMKIVAYGLLWDNDTLFKLTPDVLMIKPITKYVSKIRMRLMKRPYVLAITRLFKAKKQVDPNIDFDVLFLLFAVFSLIMMLYMISKLKSVYMESSDNYVNKSLIQIKKVRVSYHKYRKCIEKMIFKPIETQSGSEFWKKGHELHNIARDDVICRALAEVEPAMDDNTVCLTDSRKESVTGIVLRTGRMLIPAHYVKKWAREVTAVRYNSSTRGNSKFTLQVAAELCRPVGKNNDYVILDFVHGGHFADITSLFPNDIMAEVQSGMRYHKNTKGDVVKTETHTHDEAIVSTTIYNPVTKETVRNKVGFMYRARNGQGICGAPIMSGRKKTYIKGIHIAGDNRNINISYGIPVFRNDILESLSLPDNQIMTASLEKRPIEESPYQLVDVGPSEKSSLNYIGEDKNFTYLGRVGGVTSLSPCTGIHSTSASLEAAGMPNKWEQRGSRIKTSRNVDGWLRECTSATGTVNPALVRRAQSDFYAPLIEIIKDTKLRLRPLTRDEVVEGIPGSMFIHGLDGSTSAGWGHPGSKSQWMTIVNGKRMFVKEIWDKSISIENMLLRGEYPTIPNKMFLKGENGVIGKDARIATACNTPLLLVVKKYLGPILDFFCQHRALSECAVGMNPYGEDVNKLVEFLDQGIFTKYCCWDFKKFDQRIVLMVLQGMFAGYVNLAREVGYDEKSIKILSGVLSTISNPVIDVQGDLLVMVNMMMSGIYGTSHFDSSCVSGLVRCSFFEVYGLSDKLNFRSWVHLVTYGDDSILSLRGLWRFGAVDFAKFCAKVGVEVTSADKHTKLQQHVPFKDLSFLSRSFRYCNIRKRWVAPLALDSIYKSLHVYVKSKHVAPDDVLATNFDNAIVEMSLHTKDVYYKHLAIWKTLKEPVMNKVQFLDKTYEEMVAYVDNRNNPFTLPTLLIDGKPSPDIVAKQVKFGSFATAQQGVVQVQSGVIKEVPEHDVQETLETHQQETSEYMAMDLGSRESRADDNLSLNEFLERPIIIDRYTATANSLYIGFQVDPWNTLLSNARNSNRITNYANFAADIEVTALCTASPFYYGQFALMYLPTWGDDLSTVPNVEQGNIMVYQQHHIIIDVSEDKSGKLIIPFFYAQEYLNLTTGDPTDIGILDLRPVVPLRYVGDAPTDPITITVMARFINIRTRAITNRNISTISPQSGELDESGPVTKVASAIESISNAVSNIPIIGRYAKATELASAGVGALARLFGFSRPYPIEAVKQLTPKTASNFSATNIGDNVDKLTVDIRQELTIDPLLHKGRDYDPLAIANIAQRKCYWTMFEWSSSAPYGTHLGFVRVDPTFMFHNTSTDTFYIPSLAAVSIPFSYYTGSIKLTFVCVCSRFHRGRLLITYDPHDNDAVVGPGINTNTNLAYELDLEQSKEYSIVVKSSREWSYNNMYGFNNGTVGFNDYFSGITITGNANTSQGNGSVNLTVLNALSTPPSTGNLPSVKVMVFAEAMPDFRLAKPNSIVSKLYPALTVQSGVLEDEPTMNNASGDTHDYVDLDYIGETIHSLRELCKRYTILKVIDPNGIFSSNIRKTVLPGWPYYRGSQTDHFPGDVTTTGLVSYNYFITPYYQYCALMHHAARGSIRYKIVPDETVGSARRDMKSNYISWVNQGGVTSHVIGYSQEGSVLTADLMNFQNDTHTGIAFNNTLVNPMVEAEIPYQTKYLMSGIRSSSEVQHFNRLVYTQIGNVSSSDEARALVYTAAGEDYQVYWFRGLPEMRFEDVFPPSAT